MVLWGISGYTFIGEGWCAGNDDTITFVYKQTPATAVACSDFCSAESDCVGIMFWAQYTECHLYGTQFNNAKKK